MKVIIADTSCLILFDKINHLEILQDTFVELIVTDEVVQEFGSELPDWITLRSMTSMT